jgi:hypothetical protein
MNGRYEECVQKFGKKNLNRRDHMTGIGYSTILK